MSYRPQKSVVVHDAAQCFSRRVEATHIAVLLHARLRPFVGELVNGFHDDHRAPGHAQQLFQGCLLAAAVGLERV